MKEKFARRKSLSFGAIGFIICRMSKSINPDELLTVTQAADERGTTRQAINYLVRQGKLATVEIAGRRFVTRKALAEYTPDPGGRPPGAMKAMKKGGKR